MAMATDPVCGMRIDSRDAVAACEHDGAAYFFCSQACHDAFVGDPGAYTEPAVTPGGEWLDEDDLTDRGLADRARMERLVALGILEPQAGRFSRRDVVRARVIADLESLGIEVEALAAAFASGHLSLGFLESAGRQHPLSTHTFGELADGIGIPVESLQRIYIAFGLPSPAPDEKVRQEDLQAIGILPVLFRAGLAEDDVLAMARVWGDGTRRLAQYVPHYFHTTVEERFRRQGLSDNESYEAALREVGLRAGHSGEDLLTWLFRRHSEVFTIEHQYGHVETALEEAGVRRRPPRGMEAAVFADLVGYTRLTEEYGDEVAAQTALALAGLVSEAAARHGGSVVKLLGDGVYLYFRQPASALRAALDIVRDVSAAGLPPARVGVNAGPMLYDQGDYFGRTVNLASRIAAQAGAGQVYVGEALMDSASAAEVRLHELGEFQLKGVDRPVRIFQAVRG